MDNNCNNSYILCIAYLGSTLQEFGDCEMDIRKRLGMGRSAMQSLSNIWKSRDHIINDTKVRLMKSLMWPIASLLHTVLRDGHWRRQISIEAFEMWGFRRLLRIPWTQRKTNEWILEKLSEWRQTITEEQYIKTRKIRYYGHEEA